ncbi:MAG: single-stranded-DNA-specific exonuclease RecJ [Candidatus Latescibacteria bacterium]|nr:single-stranded-DNA-specific exonuclease RecJ [Candidatus Latescibacterota bacterium]
MENTQRLEPRWVVLEPQDRALLQRFRDELNLPMALARVLLNRGIIDVESAKRFLKPKLSDVHDPFLMADMGDAVELVLGVLHRGGHLMIHGDYDVDGVTGTALMMLGLRDLGARVSFYVPDRFCEGYGVSRGGIEEASRLGAELIISVDCGITAVHEVELARRLGLQFIVTDHHEPGDTLPDSLILNPKRHDCLYPWKELPGVAIAFKFLQGLFRRMGRDPTSLYRYLDLVALGCAADVVPLLDENRVFVKYGLEQMRATDNVGLRALLEHVDLYGKDILMGQVVYTLAPRINAIGRLQHARTAVEMFTTNDPEEARRIVELLETENARRREIDDQTFREAMQMIEAMDGAGCESAIVLASNEWHQGVVGIVAARIVEKVYLPVILIACGGGIGKGSGRSIPGFDLYQAVHACRDYLVMFGGHKHAAGITISQDQIDGFREAFYDYARAHLSVNDRVPVLKIDTEIDFGEIDGRFVRLLRYFEPFGQQNMRPNFLSKNLEVVGTPRIVGTNHIKFKARQNGVVFDCIGFDMGHLLYRLAPGESGLDLVYVVEENEWHGKKSIQMRLRALR